MRTLITGGVKSGKSAKALELALSSFNEPRSFLATAVAFDDEMKERIQNHQRDRGDLFTTVEEPVAIDLHSGNDLILDCLTVWINNIMYYEKEGEWEAILDRFLDRLGENAVIVTNETGLGNIPADAYTRKYNRLLSRANIVTANRVDKVIMMVSGYPVVVK